MTQNDSPRIRILRVVTRLNIGGPSKQIEVLHNQLDSSDFEQLLVAGRVRSNEEFYESESFRTARILSSLSRSNSFYQDILSTLEIVRIAKNFKPHIIHTHQSKAWLLGYFAKFFLRSNVKLVHTFHGHVLHSYFSPFKQFFIRLITRLLAQKSDALIAVSESTKSDLLKYGIGNQKDFNVIYPGFNVSFINSSKLFPIYEPTDNKHLSLLFLGRIEPIKDPFFLLEVCSKLKSLGISFSLRVVGDGSLSKEFQNKVKDLHLPVTFEGWQRNLDKIFEDVDLLVMCSKNEGTPISIIEAGMYGIPTLTNSVGGIKEIILSSDEGFIVEKNVQSYVDLIITNLSSANKGINRQYLSQLFSTRFAPETFLLSHNNLYHKVINL